MDWSPVTAEDLAEELDLGSRELVSIVGGGGKTTTLFALGRSLGPRVILTTTTKMGSQRAGGFSVAIAPGDDALDAILDRHGAALVWSERGDHRAGGVTAERCERWFESGLADYMIVEADGSRQRPFKAPEAWEPVVPSTTTLLVACIGRGALDRPISEGCHRPERLAELVGCSMDDPLTPTRAVTVLTHRDGSMRSRPDNARFAVLIHQAASADPAVEELIERLARRDPSICVVAVAPEPAVLTGR